MPDFYFPSYFGAKKKNRTEQTPLTSVSDYTILILIHC